MHGKLYNGSFVALFSVFNSFAIRLKLTLFEQQTNIYYCFQRYTWTDQSPLSFQKFILRPWAKLETFSCPTTCSSNGTYANARWKTTTDELLCSLHGGIEEQLKYMMFEDHNLKHNQLVIAYKRDKLSFVGWGRELPFQIQSWNEQARQHLSKQMLSGDEKEQVSDTFCSLMLVGNLATPEWVKVPCRIAHLEYVLCHSQEKRILNMSIPQTRVCSTHLLKHKQLCFLIIWKENSVSAQAVCRAQEMSLLHSAKTSDVTFVTRSLKLSPILLGNVHEQFTYNTSLRMYLKHMSHSERDFGFIFCSGQAQELKIGSNIKLHSEQHYISVFKELEKKTNAKHVKNIHQHMSWYQCVSNTFCGAISTNNVEDVCFLQHTQVFPSSLTTLGQSFQTQRNKSETDTIFVCNNGHHIDISQLNDFITDCHPSGEDEGILDMLVIAEIQHPCKSRNEFPCLTGHHQCFKTTDLCQYKINKQKRIEPCTNGRHLEACQSFQCNIALKCPESYCIPLEYLCNGMWDCPNGNDEKDTCSLTEVCKGAFRCSGKSHICIHLGSICDGTQNCPQRDDETLCELNGVPCPDSCTCVLHSLTCFKQFTNLLHNYPYAYVELFDILLPNLQALMKFGNLSFLVLADNSFAHLCAFRPNHLVGVIMILNVLFCVQTHCFGTGAHLEIIHLQKDNISQIYPEAFAFLPNLVTVNLSQNYFPHLPRTTFKNSLSLTVLSLLDNRLTLATPFFLYFPKFKLLEVQNKYLCCIAPAKSNCVSNQGNPHSCKSYLFPSISMNLCYLVISGFIVLLNILSITLHQIYQKDKELFTVFVLFVNVAEMLWGLYMSAIATADHLLLGSTFVNLSWQSNIFCYAILGISLLSSILPPALLFVTAFSRLHVTLYPLHSQFRNKKFVVNTCLCVCVSSFLIVVVVTLVCVFMMPFLPNSLCLAVVDSNNMQNTTKIICLSIFTFQVSILAAIILANYVTYRAIKHSQLEVNKHCMKEKSSVAMVAQWVMLCSSSFCSWIPTNIAFVLLLFTSTFSIDLLCWISVTSASLDPLFMPVIFTLVSFRFLHQNKGKKFCPTSIAHSVQT